MCKSCTIEGVPVKIRPMDNKRNTYSQYSRSNYTSSSADEGNAPASRTRRASAAEVREQQTQNKYQASGSRVARRRAAAAEASMAAAQARAEAQAAGQVPPVAASEDASVRRLSRDEYTQTHKKKRHGKLFYAAIAALVVVAVGAGAAFAYMQVVTNNLHAGLGDLSGVLVKTDLTKQPFYMLLMGTDESSDRNETGELDGVYRTDTIILARIDPVNKKVTLVSVHRDTMTDFGDEYGVGKLNAAHVYGGASLAIEKVSELAGVGISHYAEINFDGFRDIVNALGGIDVNVPIEIDDPEAGGYLAAGQQTLNGDQALILCRSRNAYEAYGAGDTYRAANQRLVISAIAKKILSSDVVTITNVVNSLSQYVTTDLSVTDIVGLAQAMQGLDTSSDMYTAMQPTETKWVDGVCYEVTLESEWKTMMKRVDAGLSPTEGNIVDSASGTILASSGSGDVGADGSGLTVKVRKAGGTVSIRNGNGIAGAGTEAATRIEDLGYSIDTSNADSFDYPETVVVYETVSDAEYAQAIVDELGCGKAVLNNNEYLFQSDFLIVLGADWNGTEATTSSSD